MAIKLNNELLQSVYPIGSIYISTIGTNPKNLFGGVWEAFGLGRCLMGAGVVEENTDDWCGHTSAGDWTAYPGLKGGETFHKLTLSEMPIHNHNQSAIYSGSVQGEPNFVMNYQYTSQEPIKVTSVDIAGGDIPHNNMPPYIVVYMWQRIG